MPLFGANARGDFVAMPTCHPYDSKSDPKSPEDNNLIMLDMDLLMGKKTLEELHKIVEKDTICSVLGVTYQAQLSDKEGNVLQIIPGQGYNYLQKPEYAVLTNFSPFKGTNEMHPWMGLDRYEKAVEMLGQEDADFDVSDGFAILKATAQTACPTVVSMVFDATERKVYWCENRAWENIQEKQMK